MIKGGFILKLLLMGPPGAGKGTQAELLTERLNIPHISTGSMFRAAIKTESELGKQAKQFMDAGCLMPDEITVGIVRERLAEPDCRRGFLLDGFPRTIPQAEALDKILAALEFNLDAVLNIEVPTAKLAARLAGRRVCRKCGATYHVLSNKPQKDGVCDECSGELYQRSDDAFATVENRLNVYAKETAPLIAYYRNQGLCISINGDQPIEAVLNDINQVLKVK